MQTPPGAPSTASANVRTESVQIFTVRLPVAPEPRDVAGGTIPLRREASGGHAAASVRSYRDSGALARAG